MFRRFGLVLVALVLVPAALAAAPSPYAVQGGEGIASNDGVVRYVAQKGPGGKTTLQTVRDRDGVVVKSQTVDGSFGIPMVGSNLPAGMFHDGSAFVLQPVGYGKQTTFQIVNTNDLSVRDTIPLEGTFAYDALSPDGKTLYLIEHVSVDDLTHYVVRAYDVGEHTLRTGKVADKAQRGWVMQGFPASRTTTKNGRWVYTLYMNPNGYPFVHALDTVNAVAHCVGFAWPKGDQGALFNYSLKIKGGKLQVRSQGGAIWRAIDLKTWRVSKR
jgi:hypothetical protein